MNIVKGIFVAALLTLLTPGSESQEDVCGKAELNTKIVGGAVAPEGSWPWQASVHNGGSHSCGGSLINNQWVLSAAHCFQGTSPSDLDVYLGRQSQEGSNPNEVSLKVVQIINHPDYSSATQDNDIALLQLNSTVSFTKYILPVCLAASDSVFNNGTDSWVTGWGNIRSGVPPPFPNDLMEVEVPIIGNRQCNCDYGVGGITDNMICAGVRSGGKDSCQGDSGGPLVMKQGGRWVQGGIVSFGQGCALPNFPGVYARVSQYNSWINSQISSNQPGFVTFTSDGTDGDLSVTCPGLPTVAPTVVCGSAPMNTRILNGSSVATAGVWPWLASLQKNGSHMCGGTLVAVDAVLSDAGCFPSSPPVASEWKVILGRLNQNGSNPFEVTLNVTNITLSNQTGVNVAVLFLESKPTLSDYIQPICIDDGRTFAEGSTCWSAGWSAGRGGEEQQLQEFQTTVQNCGNTTGNDTICTGSFTLEQGDSGGPLMCQLDSVWFQAAVLENNTNNTNKTRQSRQDIMSFTKLDSFKDFLSQMLGTFLSPASNTNATTTTNTTTSGGPPARTTFVVLFQLFVFSLCLHLFS